MVKLFSYFPQMFPYECNIARDAKAWKKMGKFRGKNLPPFHSVANFSIFSYGKLKKAN